MALMRQVDISSIPAVPVQRLVKSFAFHRKGFWVFVGVTVNVRQWRFETVGVHIRRYSLIHIRDLAEVFYSLWNPKGVSIRLFAPDCASPQHNRLSAWARRFKAPK
jgi:hypothetical protein